MTAGQNRIPVNLDYAASTPMRAEARLAQREYDDSELAGVNPNSLHSLGRKAAAHLEVARREIARSFGAPESLVEKVPTADLEDLAPGKPDEASHGVTYQQIDAFLHGQPVDQAAFDIIVATYRKTQHKRELPFAP